MTTKREVPMTGDGQVTRAELTAHIEPMKEDISEIKEKVELIPELVTQVTRINGTVDELNRWRYLLMGGGTVVTLIFGGGGITYILTEVL